ncbi:MAG: hypothetical protein GY820_05600 [Gammaproteobacteria bacterium]|nr:hypothetical protein [Gammaproteobacteria bacterium]
MGATTGRTPHCDAVSGATTGQNYSFAYSAFKELVAAQACFETSKSTVGTKQYDLTTATLVQRNGDVSGGRTSGEGEVVMDHKIGIITGFLLF